MMATNAQITHEDGTPFTEAELNSCGCPDCDALSAPALARRAAEYAEWRERKPVYRPESDGVTRKRPGQASAPIQPAPMCGYPQVKAFSIDPIPVRCPKHVLRKHPWIEAIKLEDLDDEILQKFVFGTDGNGIGWAPILAGPSDFPKGFCYDGREWSIEEIVGEIERRKTVPARVENAMQKYLRLSRVPHFWITDAERRFLQSREAAIAAMKLRMR
jgi:hypothetical protein